VTSLQFGLLGGLFIIIEKEEDIPGQILFGAKMPKKYEWDYLDGCNSVRGKRFKEFIQQKIILNVIKLLFYL